MKTDLVVKTCAKDHEWLAYAIRSWDKYAEGFNSVVIITDEGHTPPAPKRLPYSVHHVHIPQISHEARVRLKPTAEYFLASAVKMLWSQFSSAEAALVIDSDSLFTRPLAPGFWFRDGRPMWWKRPWSAAGDARCWKAGVDYFFARNTEYEYMCSQGCLVTADLANKVLNYMTNKFKEPRAFYLDPRHPRLGEYQMWGGYIDLLDNCGYLMLDQSEIPQPWPIRQFWSWGNINKDRTEMEAICTGQP